MTQSSQIRHEGSQFKNCKKCGEAKPLTEFHRQRRMRDGLAAHCKACCADYQRVYQILKKDLIAEKKRVYRKANKDRAAASHKAWRDSNKERDSENQKRWNEENKEHVSARAKVYYQKNRERILSRHKEYREPIKKELSKAAVAYVRQRLRSDPEFKLIWKFRARFRRWFKQNGTTKKSSILQAVGCTPEEVRRHIESKFKPGMTWGNHGFGERCWHVDHIIPLASAGNDAEAMIKLWHYTNLQPMWHTENLRKGART